jgi:hypothetical protein
VEVDFLAKLQAKPPESVWNKPLTFDAKALMKGVAKSIVHAATGKWSDAAIDTSEVFTSLGVKTHPNELAWLLISRALLSAIFDLTKETANTIIIGAADVETEFAERLAATMTAAPPEIQPTFFTEPAASTFLSPIKILFVDWLTGHGLESAAANAIASRLPSHFTFALHDEWVRNTSLYRPIVEAVESPFTRSTERERVWSLYRASLNRQADESMLGEPFSLKQLFVPLRAFYLDTTQPFAGQAREARRVVVELENELDRWLVSGKRDDAVRIISGGPGSGKSSFARLYAAKASQDPNRRVLFIPLHQFDPAGDLQHAVGEFVRSAAILPHNPLEPDTSDRSLLIILDGLDELAMQGKLANEVAQSFLREVQRQVALRNHTSAQLLVLVTGRELVIQSNAAEFRRLGEILHVLPYYVDVAPDSGEWHDPDGLLSVDQRSIWWSKYGQLTGRPYETLPRELGATELQDVTSQPLLNYLVALSYIRGALDFSKHISLNAIYEDLIRAVYERAYAGHTHLSIRGLEYSQFIRVMEEIGLAAWHGDGRTTTVREIEEHCAGSGLGELLDTFQEGAKTGVTRLLTAFYFRQHSHRRDGEKTFEFTHKSFGEYLIARRLIRAVKIIEDEMSLRRLKMDRGWGEREAIKHWLMLCGQSPLDHYLASFVRNEVAIQSELAGPWQTLCERLVTYALTVGMPVELVEPRPRYRDEERLARNAEESLLVVMNACALQTKQLSKVAWPDSTAAGQWIAKLHGQRRGGENTVTLESLSFLDLSKCTLHMRDFYGANMERTNFAGAEIAYANCIDIRASGADFTRASLHGSSFEGADLRGSQFTDAYLQDVNFSRAAIGRAVFRNTVATTQFMRAFRKRGLRATPDRTGRLPGTVRVSGTATADPPSTLSLFHRLRRRD